jgi:hypothetical protein
MDNDDARAISLQIEKYPPRARKGGSSSGVGQSFGMASGVDQVFDCFDLSSDKQAGSAPPAPTEQSLLAATVKAAGRWLRNFSNLRRLYESSDSIPQQPLLRGSFLVAEAGTGDVDVLSGRDVKPARNPFRYKLTKQESDEIIAALISASSKFPLFHKK